MLRPLFLALALILAAPTNAPAQPPSDQICGGHFERYLKGFTIGDGELDHFLQDDDAVADCRAELDKTDLEHRLIDAYILEHQNAPEREASLILYDAACAQGSALGCWHAALLSYGVSGHYDQQKARLDKSNSVELPVALTRRGGLPFDPQTGAPVPPSVALLRRASDRGDYWATDLLAIVASIEGGEPGLQAMLTLMRKAAEQGHVPSLTKLAEYRISRHDDHDGAIALFRRAAAADSRWFRADIAWAQYRLALLLRDGERVRRDPAEAQRWLDTAAALGNEQAKQELGKK